MTGDYHFSSETAASTSQNLMGPHPMQLVVVIAVRNAVSAATIIFTANSINLFFAILFFNHGFHGFKNADSFLNHGFHGFYGLLRLLLIRLIRVRHHPFHPFDPWSFNNSFNSFNSCSSSSV